jgi:Na+-translocating ferredoxin:NAD+ oxidoreductase RnfC subunit
MTPKPHAMREGRRVPIKSLMRKLQLQDYDHPAPLRTTPLQPDRVTLRLKQSAGVPAKAVVAAGDRVTAGQLIAEPPANALGALLHAPFAARVESVTATQITLTRSA